MSNPRSKAAIETTRLLAVKESADNRGIVNHVSQKPFFWLGDTAWELFHRLGKAEARTYLENRAAKGFNVVMIVVMAEHGGLDYPSRDGHYPFQPAAESTPDKFVPDVSKINPSYFDFVDWVVDLAASLGIVTALVPTWGKYFNYGYFKDGPIIFNAANITTLGEYCGSRYPYSPFLVGGDSNKYWAQHITPFIRSLGDNDVLPEEAKQLPIEDSGPVTEALAAALATGVSRTAPDYTPFIAYHPAACWLHGTPPASGSDYFPGADWLSLDAVQSGHRDGRGRGGDQLPGWKATYSYVPVRRMYAARRKDGRPRPVMDLEGHYESTNYGFNTSKPLWDAADIRNGTLQSLYAGACGITYGVNSIWQMHNPSSETHPPIIKPTVANEPWYEELDLPGAFQVIILRDFIVSLPDYTQREPSQGIIVSDTHEGEGETLVSGMRSTAGLWATVATPFGEPVSVDLDVAIGGVKNLGKAEWFRPKTGERSSIELAGVDVKGAVATFVPLSKGTKDDDWVLVVFAK